MMGLARFRLKKIKNLEFWKLFGSGTGEGFTPVPNFGVYGVLCVWENEDAARNALKNESLFKRYLSRASNTSTILMKPISSRGYWSGSQPFTPKKANPEEFVAVLTRATVRWSKLRSFWSQAPDISDRIGRDKNVMFKIGLGEVPIRQQLTFSIWNNLEHMKKFAHHAGSHKDAIQKVRKGDWFSEELYARFNVIEVNGNFRDFNQKKQELINE
ncbi:MAG: spheroidene monooxygenase [Paracoccaceae bacterium]